MMTTHHEVNMEHLAPTPNLILAPQYINDINELQNPIFEITSPLRSARQQHRTNIRMLLYIILFLVLQASSIWLFISASQNMLLKTFSVAFLITGIILVFLTVWQSLTGSLLFQKLNLLKMIAALVILIAGLTLTLIANQESALVLGYALFATAGLILIEKFFFLAEDDQSRIERLERELQKTKQSAGMGMALAYFYNFIVPTAANIRSIDEGHTPIDMEVSRGKFEEYKLKNDQLFIMIPRNLDGSDMKVFLKNLSSSAKPSVMQGKPKERPGNDTHRPMFVYFLEWNTTVKECNGLFDIPTIISSCWDRYKHEKEINPNTISVSDEIIIFQNQLVSLINGHPITYGKVRVVSFPSLPFRFENMKYAVTHLTHP